MMAQCPRHDLLTVGVLAAHADASLELLGLLQQRLQLLGCSCDGIQVALEALAVLSQRAGQGVEGVVGPCRACQAALSGCAPGCNNTHWHLLLPVAATVLHALHMRWASCSAHTALKQGRS